MQIKFIVSTFEDFTDLQIRELREAISHWYGVKSVRGGEWLDFDTAPKDGTHILVWRRGLINEAWWKKDILGNDVWGGEGWSFPEWDLPTHWTPKPLPPSNLPRPTESRKP